MGDNAPVRPVAEQTWLKPTGALPLGSDPSTSRDPNFDIRTVSDGGCDSPAHFEGCHVYYMKVRTSGRSMSEEKTTVEGIVLGTWLAAPPSLHTSVLCIALRLRHSCVHVVLIFRVYKQTSKHTRLGVVDIVAMIFRGRDHPDHFEGYHVYYTKAHMCSRGPSTWGTG